MSTHRNFSNVAVTTTLNGGISDTDTSLVVTSATGYPAAPFTILIESEIILVGNKSGTTFSSLTREYDGTTKANHSNGVQVRHIVAGIDVGQAKSLVDNEGDDRVVIEDNGDIKVYRDDGSTVVWEYVESSSDLITPKIVYDGPTGGVGGSVSAYDVATREVLLLEGGNGSLTDARLQIYGASDASSPNNTHFYTDSHKILGPLSAPASLLTVTDTEIRGHQPFMVGYDYSGYPDGLWGAASRIGFNKGSLGSMGSFRLGMHWNFERGETSGYDSLGVNGYTSAGQVTIGNDGIRFWYDDADYAETGDPPLVGEIKETAWKAQAGGTGLIEIFPKGHIYDWGFDTNTSQASLGTYPVNITGLVATASVPANVSVTIMVWAWNRVNLTVNQAYAALDVTIGGSLIVNPALVEQDLTTDAGGDNVDVDGTSGSDSHTHNTTGSTDTASGHLHGSGSISATNDSHSHSSGSYTVNGTHTHALSGSWHTLNYFALRNYTPTGSTVTLQARGGTASGSQTYDNGALMYMVILN